MGNRGASTTASRSTGDIDREWLIDVLVTLLRTSTQVPYGQTEIRPGDARIVGAVQDTVLPWITDLGPDEVRQHPLGDIAARFGPLGDDGLLLQTYVVSQHANLMDGTQTGELIDGERFGLTGLCAIGQGASQNKGALAAAFAAVQARPEELSRPLWLSVNTEGMSSHEGSKRILEELGVGVDHAILAFGTNLEISLGNRGRIDIEIKLRGESCHSSQPWLGANPIPSLSGILQRLADLPLPASDEDLGPAAATPYQVFCYPVAPHTIPEEVTLRIDRRMLPGEDTDQVLEDVRNYVVGPVDAEVGVPGGVVYLPARVRGDEPVVQALRNGLENAARRPARAFFSMNAFDAGYACSKGIATPMFGPGKRRFTGAGLLGTDMVSIEDCVDGAKAICHTIESLCSGSEN